MTRIEAVNDFVVKFANVNGSGSASANELFAKSIMRMGVPVSPRNIFPSNIQGLPTWYEVRVSEKGWLGRRGGVDMMVAMNPQTWDGDVAELSPGGYLFYDNTRPLPPSKFRDDVHVIGMPLTEICNAVYDDPRQRQLFKNIVYVGALSVLLEIEAKEIEKLFGEQYRGKEKLLSSNVQALHLGREFAQEHLQYPLGLRVRRADRWASASSSTATAPARWAPSMAAPPSWPGTRSRPRPRWPRPSRSTAARCASTRTRARTATPWCRRRTSSPPSAWWWAPAGTARAPGRPPRARACR
jgi:Pyruvate/2-oxoacid:ferredoxin oxidoreductase gamma subunit